VATRGDTQRGSPAVVPLGTYDGVPVRAHWSLLVTAALIAWILAGSVLPAEAPDRSAGAYWGCGAVGAVVFLASVLAHELMHAIAARHYSVRVERITLWLLGGMAEIKGDPPTPRAAAVIAGAGPAASIGLGAMFAAIAWGTSVLGFSTLITATLAWLAITNGILGVFNLLPGAPLDGGRLLQAVLWRRYRDSYRATVAAARVGRQLGAGLVTLGLLEAMFIEVVSGLWLALIGWFLVSAAAAESAGAALRAVPPALTMGQLMRPLPAPAPSWWTPAHLREMRQMTELIHDVLPVVDFDGRAVGVLTWRDVSGGDARREESTLGALCRRMPVVAADVRAADALRAGALSRGAVLVQDANGGFGLVSTADLEHAAAIGRSQAGQLGNHLGGSP
jgi:Zn-dependent protease